MDVAIGAANWLVGKVLDKLSNDLVAAYVASSELGLNSEQIKTKLKFLQGLLHAAQERDVSNNPGLQSLLEDLSKKADEAEDALDELHYFMIQDRLDGTHEAAPEMGDGFHGHALHGRHAAHHTIVQTLEIEELNITGELSSEVLKCFPAVSQFTIRECEGLELPLVEDGGLLDLKMLQSFTGYNCGKLFSRWPMGKVAGGAHAINPFPTSLTELDILSEPSLQSMGLLSNLTSLTSLCLESCEELTMDGFNPYIIVNLKKLTVDAMYLGKGSRSIAGDLLSEIARSKLMHAGSFQLDEFLVDNISAVLTAPICSHLATTLHTLGFSCDQRGTTFTEEQEQALQLLTSLEDLNFQCCENLQSLPQGLRGLFSLKRLYISFCKKIQRLPPKEGLPASLETLYVWDCSLELTEQAEKLKASDPWFSVNIPEPRN
ncbi:hypothetical protein ZWY2020_023863 [Hordeum vulgare]|nr:hypothetical protein ZWY2020_023863 [Hordeum vulgare]